MKRIVILVLALAAGIVAGRSLWQQLQSEVYVSHRENVMGTSLDISVQARSESAATRAETEVLAEIARESKILSGYDPDSEFSRWLQSRGRTEKLSPELIDVLTAFDEWRTRTDGALDPSVEALTRVWQRAESANRLPADADLQSAVAQVRQRHWIVDRAASTATRTSDVPVMLNSFTKSYVIDRAARRALQVPGVTGVLLNAGGDVVVRGDWARTVGVADPLDSADNAEPMATLVVRDGVVATSGGYKRGFDIGGKHYSHVIDPRTGQPTGHVLSATVIAPNAIEAGALATSLCVLSPEESLALGQTVPGAEFVLTLANGARVESAGWQRVATRLPAPRMVRDAMETVYAADQASWSAGWQLTVALEVARQPFMARRPYVAVWIEDKDRHPVRTIALWFNGKARYLPELRAWYRSDRLRAMAEGNQIVDTVSSPTRSAGKYVLEWDGKDNAGRFVKAGPYTVWIEAAREHGTYQIAHQDMDFSGMPKQITLPGGTELSAISLDYHQVGR
jgi:thiamine biosynthesis lipoprotein ApbE